jgi:hypothetical protein
MFDAAIRICFEAEYSFMSIGKNPGRFKTFSLIYVKWSGKSEMSVRCKNRPHEPRYGVHRTFISLYRARLCRTAATQWKSLSLTERGWGAWDAEVME